MTDKAIRAAKLTAAGILDKARARTAVTRAGGQIAPSKYLPDVPRQVHAGGGKVAYHATHEPFEDYDWGRLGQSTKENTSGTSVDDWASSLASLGPWSHEKPLSKKLGMKTDLPVTLTGKEKKFKSLDHLAQEISRHGGPAALREKLVSQGYGHASVDDEEFGGKSYVGLSPDHFKITKAEGGRVGYEDGGTIGGTEPKNTVKAYKLFKRKKDGNIYPLFVNANKPVPIGQWLDAEEGPQGKSEGKVKSSLGDLAYRPGWHAGDLPVATHIGGKSRKELTAPDYRPDDHVWAEVEMPNDVDWQSVANSRMRHTADGRPILNTAHITDQLPKGGFYRYKTNPNMTGNWLIGGSMKVNRILSDDEVKKINDAAGTADLPRMSDMTKAEGGSVTDNENFRNWFGNSPTHTDGDPHILYTGTSKDKDFTAFNVGRHGTWFTRDPALASQYAEQNDSQGYKQDGWKLTPINTASRVIPAYVKAENPYTGDLPDEVLRDNYKKAQSDWFDTLRRKGHDAWIPARHNGNLVVVLKEPQQIKSIFNNGKFDPNQKHMGKAGGGEVDGITAYHGSPHDFDQFDISKLGTGEGAQAYGHGLYFAGNEKIAKHYRDKLSMGASSIDGRPMADIAEEKHKLPYGQSPTIEHNIADIVSSYGDNARPVMQSRYPELLSAYDNMVLNGRISAGRMYKVKLNVKPSELLDWDKPLSEQPEVARKLGYASHEDINQRQNDLQSKMRPIDMDKFYEPETHILTPEEEQAHIDAGPPLEHWGNMTGKDFHDRLVAHTGSKKGAADAMQAAGLKGIRYLDAGSRGMDADGDPTHNYVMFHHDPVQVTDKYEYGGTVDDDNPAPVIKNPMSIFPKPQRMFPEDQRPKGGQYISTHNKADVTGHKAEAATIGIGPNGKPFFHASQNAVDQTGTVGKGSATTKTNLFKQKAGWKWQDAPEGHENTDTIVSVEHRGKHFYALNAHFPKGVDLARYENASSEPRLRPTTQGNVTLGPQAGSISVRGKTHPVYHHVIVKADGGTVDAALALTRRFTKDGIGATVALKSKGK